MTGLRLATQNDWRGCSLSYFRSNFNNAYILYDETTDNYITPKCLIGTCRDSFLFRTHESFLTGQKKVKFLLVLPHEKAEEKQTLNDYWISFYANRNHPLSYEFTNLLIQEYSLPCVKFEFSATQYTDPMLFWLVTHEIRKQLTKFSKIDESDNVHKSVDYISLCNVIRRHGLSTFNVTGASNELFLHIHSPAGLITSMLDCLRSMSVMPGVFKTNSRYALNILQSNINLLSTALQNHPIFNFVFIQGNKAEVAGVLESLQILEEHYKGKLKC